MLKQNKRGQATVEYILMIVVIASLVVGLTSFNSTIEQKFKDAKLGVRNKLSGEKSELTRQDFFSGKITVKEGDGAGGKGGVQKQGSRGGGGGEAGGKNKGTGGEEGTGGLGDGKGGQTAETQTQEPDTPQTRRQRVEQEQEEIDRSNRAAQEYREAQKTEEEVYEEKEKEAISERQLALASEEERARLLRRAKEEGITTEKQQAMEDRNWKIGKFIIIIMLLLFVFVIILKSRQGRD